jgi:hypothetical protein
MSTLSNRSVTTSSRLTVGIIGRNEETGDEDTEDVEDEDSVEHTTDCLGNVSALLRCAR